jgi:hypothetical protein
MSRQEKTRQDQTRVTTPGTSLDTTTQKAWQDLRRDYRIPDDKSKARMK